jgi:hypothetical protein
MNTTNEKAYAVVSAKDLINIIDEKMNHAFNQIKELEYIDPFGDSRTIIQEVTRLQQLKIDINHIVKDADAFKKLIVVQRLDEISETMEEATA